MSKGGTYKITNTLNGHFYIGSCKNFKSRWAAHKSTLQRKVHSNPRLQRAVNKHGLKSFLFEIIETIEGNKQLRINAEQLLLDQYFDGGKKCYNANKQAQTNKDGVFSHTPNETRKRLSESHKGQVPWIKGRHHTEESKKKMSKAHKGKKLTEEQKKKLFEANKGRKLSKENKEKLIKARTGSHHTDEMKKKLSAKNKEIFNRPEQVARASKKTKSLWKNIDYRKRMLDKLLRCCKKIYSIELETNKKRYFKSIVDAAEHYNISPCSIGDVLKGRTKKCKQGTLRFEYLAGN